MAAPSLIRRLLPTSARDGIANRMGCRHPVLLLGLLASAFASASAPAFAQSAESARTRPEQRERGFSYGGSITGRMNLLGPKTEDGVTAPALPAAPSPPFQGGLGARQPDDPNVLNGLTLPNLIPKTPGAPSAPAPGESVQPTPAGLPAPTLTAPIVKQALTLSASFGERGGKIPNGVKWRVFTEQPDVNGEHLLVAESTEAAPKFELDPGAYLVHAVYGLVSAARTVTVDAKGPAADTLVLNAGAVRLTALVGDVKIAPERVGFTLTRDDGGMIRTVAENVRPGTLLRLPAGAYHVVSAYGDANAIVEVDLQIAAGKFVEAQVHHKAARMTLKLVDAAGGPQLADTSWTVLTPGGDVIRESIGQLPPVVLSEGDYVAIARRDGRTFQQNFEVRAGFDAVVEVRGG